MIAVLPTDDGWGAGVSLAVTDDPMVLSTDLAAMTAGWGASVTVAEQPPLALLQSPQATAPAVEPWAEAIVVALAALPTDLPRWSREKELEPSPQQVWVPTDRLDDTWLRAVNRPVRLWSAIGAADVTDPLNVATRRSAKTVSALPARPFANIDYRRPRAKPTLAVLPAVGAGEEAQVPEARATKRVPVVVSAARPAPAFVYDQTQLVALAACEADGSAAACGVDDDESRQEPAPATAKPAADPRSRHTAVVRRSARTANSANAVRRRDPTAGCRRNRRLDCRDICSPWRCGSPRSHCRHGAAAWCF